MDGFVTKAMAQFFADNPPKAFQPCAYYDKHLDCIRVQVKDCSFTEIRLNELFTIYQANHTESREYMGFSIKGIRHLLEKSEFPKAKQGPFMLAEILDHIVKVRPEFTSDLISILTINLNLEVKDFEYDKAA
ncbi:MAG: hypothetical protein ACLPYB_10390 [Desulfobaccales bacterium]